MRNMAAAFAVVVAALLVAAAGALAVIPMVGAGGEQAIVELTQDEIDTLLSHGPWPASVPDDASNRVSGSAGAIALGRTIFFDTRFSENGRVSCATCHQPERFWTDGRALGLGLSEVDRNTPTIANVRFNRWFGWDGRSDSLWAHSMEPFLDSREMNGTERSVAQTLRGEADLSCGYERAFGRKPPADDEAVLVDIGKALAAFQATVISGRTPFDDFRDALARGDRAAVAVYPADAQRGAKIFAGRGRCSLCHFGPNFTHGEFHEIGIPIFRKSGGVDWGRYQGIKLLRSSRFNRLGPFNDDRDPDSGISTGHVELHPQTFEQFKVPSLRNVALTAPYMHNGHFATLEAIVRHYSTIDPTALHVAHVYLFDEYGLNESPPTDQMMQPFPLTESESADLVAFLNSLTETTPSALPPAPPDPCAARRQ